MREGKNLVAGLLLAFGTFGSLVAALLLSGCSDLQIQSAQARHREWVCGHTVAATTAANLALSEASKIKDENIRNAAILAAQAELDLIASCGE